MKTVYLVVKIGVYIQDLFGVFSEEDKAKEFASMLAEKDIY